MRLSSLLAVFALLAAPLATVSASRSHHQSSSSLDHHYDRLIHRLVSSPRFSSYLSRHPGAAEALGEVLDVASSSSRTEQEEDSMAEMDEAEMEEVGSIRRATIAHHPLAAAAASRASSTAPSCPVPVSPAEADAHWNEFAAVFQKQLAAHLKGARQTSEAAEMDEAEDVMASEESEMTFGEGIGATLFFGDIMIRSAACKMFRALHVPVMKELQQRDCRPVSFTGLGRR